MTHRTCGEGAKRCTACCKTHPVLEIDKPLMTWCRHCEVGKGCKIYEERPKESCGAFKCGWLVGFGKDHERPDKTRLVFDLAPSPLLGHDTFAIYEVSPGALATESALYQKHRILQHGGVVSELKSTGKLRITFPLDYRLSKEKAEHMEKEGIEVCLYQQR